MDNTLNKIMNC